MQQTHSIRKPFALFLELKKHGHICKNSYIKVIADVSHMPRME
jgi:hypothetical protein